MATTKKKATKRATATRKATKKKAAAKAPAAKAKPPGRPARRSPYVEAIIAHALSLPEAWEDHPWGEIVAKVGKKVFVFFGVEESFGMAVKLPASGAAVLAEPFAEPCGYGLGKSGWVTIRLDAKSIPLERAKAWIEESYLAVAPKKLALAWATGG